MDFDKLKKLILKNSEPSYRHSLKLLDTKIKVLSYLERPFESERYFTFDHTAESLFKAYTDAIEHVGYELGCRNLDEHCQEW